MRILGLLFSLILLSSCASLHYSRVREGQLDGRLVVEWVDPDLFIFTPDKQRPLKFIRHNKEVIIPGRMYTDGGSIPRPLWALRSYSPWGYAPAFIIHDWLFEVKRCKLEGQEKYNVDDAAMIMSEIMKTMMLDPKRGYEDRLTVYAMYEAVRSPVAEEVWNNSDCKPPRSQTGEAPPLEKLKPSMRYVIEFP